MEYIRSSNREQYIDEITDISFGTLKLIKDPRCKIKRLSKIIPVFFILDMILVVCSVPMIITLFTDHSISLIIFAVIVAICFLYITLILIGFAKRKKEAKNSHGEIDCDAEGITFTSSSRTNQVPWSNIQCIRVFEYSMMIIPKKQDISQAMLIAVENLENLENCMKEFDVDIEIIR